MRRPASFRPYPALLLLAACCAAPGAARPDANGASAAPPGSVRPELVGSWICADAWLIERSGGRGPNTLKLKADGKYVLTARPKGIKHFFRVYGRWGADEKQLYRDSPWYQKDMGKLEPLDRAGDFGGIDYALASDRSTLTVGDTVFKRDRAQAKP